jgi:anthranilate synthase component 2
MHVLVVDNYDSFTWNLVQGLEAAGAACSVHRNDAIDVRQVEDLAPDRLVLSPGPFGPEATGVCADLVRALAPRLPILGVCLGMQVIAAVAGARVGPSGAPVHGKQRRVHHDGSGVLAGLPSPMLAGLYHSLIVEPESVPETLRVTAWTDAGTLMGVRLRGTRTEGTMFHPESFLTEHGDRLLRNFLEGADVE